ncbi:MAG: 6-carboxytetrahydropterin synthase [Candidatus Peribacteraceae bacterium]|nr:6-carboxytetrahydropterin synthase [Candidatus Peribacteraceae bacterium]
MKSTIYLNNITTIDFSYLGTNGVVYGESLRPGIELTGDVDNDENVVIDFSKAKKKIKELIDHPDTGFDHKCWIVVENSKDFKFSINGLQYTTEHLESFRNGIIPNDSLMTVVTPTTTITAPMNAFRVTHNYGLGSLEEYLNSHLKEDGIQVKVYHEDDSFMTRKDDDYLNKYYNPMEFTYVHGLKSSSSWGCQNIVHGHYSCVQVEHNGESALRDPLIQNSLSNILDNSLDKPLLFVWKENITEETEDIISFGYKCSRGMFAMSVYKEFYTVVVLETETTIENLVEWFATTYNNELKRLGAVSLSVSEGLDKGATITI